MRIERPLLKLPIRFCGDTLAREVNALPADAWMAHPQKFDGNIGLPLVSPGGGMTDGWSGPMAATEALRACPYIMQVMAELDATWGRSRLMGLEPGCVVPEHVDVHYYWRTHLRIHIPIITNPDVTFRCAGERLHLQPGECWILDSFFPHSVENRGSETRVHLVLDTVGSGRLWDLIDAADGSAEGLFVGPQPGTETSLAFEQINAPEIMSPWEIREHLGYLRSWVDDGAAVTPVEDLLDRFVMEWSGLWVRFGTAAEGTPHYSQALESLKAGLVKGRLSSIPMRNGRDFVESLRRFIIANAINPAKLAMREEATASSEKPRITT